MDEEIPYDEIAHTGLIRHLVVRVNRKGEAMATLVAANNAVPHLSELTTLLKSEGATSFFLNIHSKATNVIFGDSFLLQYGKATLTDTLCDLQFELSPAAFFQVNPVQTEVLYQIALDFAQLKFSDTLYDVYCGAGTISLLMARHCRQVTGIEVVPAAVLNARENAQRNGISNAVFQEGRAEKVLPLLVQRSSSPDVIVVDPPRKGLEPVVIDAIAQAQPDRLVYVSCNPATLARDCSLLHQHGYAIQQIQPVDMFPYTPHVETVVLMSRVKG